MIEMSAIVAGIIGLAEAAKGFGLPAKWVPLLNLVLGIAGVCGLNGGVAPELVFSGVVAGLTASGLYSGVKNVAQGTKETSGEE